MIFLLPSNTNLLRFFINSFYIATIHQQALAQQNQNLGLKQGLNRITGGSVSKDGGTAGWDGK